jgi:hemerythrin-like domain-containing protein
MKTAMQQATHIIEDEHRSISAVLQGLVELARAARNPAVQPEFPVLHAMVYYIDTFPERLHHPKEEDVLFARLVARAPEAQPLVEELRAEHQRGARLIRELEAALLAFQVEGGSKAEAFCAAAQNYAQFHWDHMRKEERDLLPLAERCLAPADWEIVAAAFAGNEDPVADLREKDYRDLYQRILSLAPAPVGLGEPWRRSA